MGTRGSPLRPVGVPGVVAAVVRGARELSAAIADVAEKLNLWVALNSPRNGHPWRCQLSRQMRDAGGAAGARGGGSRGGVQAGARAVAGSYGGGTKVAGAVVVLVLVLVSGPAGAGW